jgi:uncharacterized protein YceH (UPF0502 family)
MSIAAKTEELVANAVAAVTGEYEARIAALEAKVASLEARAKAPASRSVKAQAGTATGTGEARA